MYIVVVVLISSRIIFTCISVIGLYCYIVMISTTSNPIKLPAVLMLMVLLLLLLVSSLAALGGWIVPGL